MSNENFVRTVSYGRPDDLIPLDKKSDLVTPLLGSLLGLCTPNGTEEHIVNVIRNQSFVNKYKRFLDPKLGNYVIQVPIKSSKGAVKDSRSIFSCHMDIVGSNHKDTLAKNKVEKIFFFSQEEKRENTYGMIWGAKGNVGKNGQIANYSPSTLGADDKVGVYILLRMIEAGIPGTYLFHTGEECGGLGSAFLAAHYKELFENKDRAIAFDRAGYNDVIGFQRQSRCCSTEFGKALAVALNDYMPPKSKFKEDAHGSFTDTANYTKLVPECTNVSVGYFNQHGSGEHLDAYWLEEWLIPSILRVKYEDLPVVRDPKEVPKTYSQSYSNYSNTPKKEWKEVTTKTPYNEFPLWRPELSIPDGAVKEVLIMAMGRFMSSLNYGKQKDDFCDWVIGKLQHIDLLEEENVALHSALAMVNGPPKANPPDIILLPPPNNFAWKQCPKCKGSWNPETTEWGCSAVDIDAGCPIFPDDYKRIDRQEKSTIDFETKVSLLTRLVVIADKVILSDADDQKWLNNYNTGAKKFLGKLGDKDSFTDKETAKANRIIFALGILIDTALVLTKEEEKVLDDVQKHALETDGQEGWYIDYKQPTVH